MIADASPHVETPKAARPGTPMRWSVEKYLAVVQAGILGPEANVELLDGEIVQKMGQDFPHIDGITLLVEALRAALGTGFVVRTQLPLKTPDSVPEPDVSVLRGLARDFLGRYPDPGEVALVAEVANTSLKDDRLRKAGIYARAGFAEYWILNVADRQLETYRNPLPSGVFGEARVYGEHEAVLLEGREFAVAELLP